MSTQANIESILSGNVTVHIFGYGSLTWKPDFDYDRSFVGYVKGYERRFWQASTYHRGTKEHPGRCVTLTPVENGTTWGLVYEISDTSKIATALDYLNVREQKIGGYEVYVVPVHPLDSCDQKHEAMYSILYIATPECKGFLGEDSYDKLAGDIATSCGKIGHNIEYLFRLTDFMREFLPGEPDEHLYTLDRLVRRKTGVNENGTETWFELLDKTDFERLVYPPSKYDYKKLWRKAIMRQVRKKSKIDRWALLLLQIDNMRDRRSDLLEKVEFGTSLDIGDDELYGVDEIDENGNVVRRSRSRGVSECSSYCGSPP
ncbi:glutathione-specific gamma-glutamylcyclotransferase 1-like [Clytia hemisphaerica]|eukprot:TCONS_00046168-protein